MNAQYVSKGAFYILPLFLSGSFAQSNDRPVMMQMRNGKIYFDNTYALDADLKKGRLI